MHPVMAHYIAQERRDVSPLAGQRRDLPAPGPARPARASCSSRRISRARCSSWWTRSARRAAAGASPGLRAARDAFYRGDLAAAMVRYHARERRLAHRATTWRTTAPRSSARSRPRFRGIEVLSCGPWCQGPVLLQMLSLLAADDLAALGHNTPAYVHLVAEAMKLCFADRERYYGDPRFVARADGRAARAGLRGRAPAPRAAGDGVARDAAGRRRPGLRPPGRSGEPTAVALGARRGEPRAARRHLLRLRRRPARQRVVRDAERRRRGRAR